MTLLSGARAWLLFGPGAAAPALWSGRHEFSAALLPTVVAPERRRRLTSTRGSVIGAAVALTGLVDVEEGYNCSVFVGGGSLVIGASAGSGYGRPCAPGVPPSTDCPALIFKINGAGPDSLGRFVIKGGPGIVVQSENGVIRLTSTISGASTGEPGCQETN